MRRVAENPAEGAVAVLDPAIAADGGDTLGDVVDDLLGAQLGLAKIVRDPAATSLNCRFDRVSRMKIASSMESIRMPPARMICGWLLCEPMRNAVLASSSKRQVRPYISTVRVVENIGRGSRMPVRSNSLNRMLSPSWMRISNSRFCCASVPFINWSMMKGA